MKKPKITFKENYRNVSVKLVDLCDYIIKRAMILSALNIKFTSEELDILKLAQNVKTETEELVIEIDNSGNTFDELDVDYEIYLQKCPECEGNVKVIDFTQNDHGHNFNVYKCEVCGHKVFDELPNKHEHVIEFFESLHEIYQLGINDPNVKAEDKLMLKKEAKDLKKSEKILLKSNEEVIRLRENQRSAILSAIAANEDMYKELSKFKHTFDRNIGEA